ncbi:hypothetical protein LCGC14_2568320 [marine sediment metagenome]|uniref:Uncharacterized protein n=1 Tax=marine sediment metagenome TaxID=412755 RepID=A0A0F9B5X6_9ZZZZ
MAKKTQTKKRVPKKKSKALVKKRKKPEKKALPWAGGADLMMQSDSPEHKIKKDSIIVISEALKITPFGVNILGGLPYINNLGLKQKSLFEYHKGANFEYNWVKRSEDDTDKAICEVRLVKGKTKLTPWIVGECSPASMKMGTLKGYQNHMAQTRAENRAIRFLDGVRMHLDLLNEIGRMRIKGDIDDKVASEAVHAITAGAEEINEEPQKNAHVPKLAPVVTKTQKSNPVQIAVDQIRNATNAASLTAMNRRVNELMKKGEFSQENGKYLSGLIKKRLIKMQVK